VHNIVFTIIGEKPFRRDFGTVVNQSLFELDTSLNMLAIEKQITSSLSRFEPRIKLNDVKVVVDGSHNAMTAKITYSIIGLMSPIQIVDVLLLPARV
jgi:phage baseplate assembly protein W